MAEVRKNAKRISDHAKKKARRNAEPRNGYEYQMPSKQYEYLLSDDGGKLKDMKAVIDYLNKTGGFLRQITRLSVM